MTESTWAAFESVPDATVVVDVHSVIVFANKQAEDLLGYSAHALRGRPLECLLPPASRGPHGVHVMRYMREPRTRPMGSGLELWAVRADGREVPVEISLGPLRSGEDQYVVASIRDASLRRQVEQELSSAKLAAEAANDAKSEFLSSMSHELRTPLNAVLGFAQLLLRDKRTPLAEKHRGYVEHVLRGGEHLLRLIDEILDLAKVESGQISMSISAVDVVQLAHEVAATLDPVATRAKVQLQVSAPVQVVVPADRTRLQQILLNFASNAIKYSGEGCLVSLVVERQEGMVQIRIEDNGRGVPLVQQDRLFSPFFRAGQEAGPIEGTGIGLAISKRLAEMMGGSVGFRSEPGVLTSFWVRLPIYEAKPKALSHWHSSADLPESNGRGRLVLYVEDNPASLALMRELIESFDHVRLLTAPSAEIGIDLALTHHPDLIILDLNLPGMDGFQALRRLRGEKETQDIPVVSLSAAATTSDRAKAKEAGFLRHFTKPLQLDELITALEEVFQGPAGSL